MSEMPSHGEKRERWMQLAAQIAAEQDPKKFHDLVVELNNVLEEKEQRTISLVKSNRSDANQKVERGPSAGFEAVRNTSRSEP